MNGVIEKIIMNSADPLHDSITTITSDHNGIHTGNTYSATRTTSALGASSWFDLEIITTTTVRVHLLLDVNNSGGLAEVNLLEMSSTSSTQITQPSTSGLVTALNRNRLSTNVAKISIYNDSTGVIATTTQTQMIYLHQFYIGSTGSVSSRGDAGLGGFKDEFILKQGTTYICRLINRGVAGYASMRALWYEGV